MIPPHTACLLCSASGTTHLIERLAKEKVEYKLYECTVCLGQFWTPFQNPGASWYAHDERYADRNADPIVRPNKKHIDVLQALKGKTGRVLDVGCGVGNFLAYAEQCGWEGWGIDFDADAIAAAKRLFDLSNLEVTDLISFARQHPDLQFDLITFFDVFEHLDDHAAFLHQVKTLLAPGGHIAFSVPYRHAWRFLIPADLPPRHLTRWDEQSLEHILLRHGFETTFLKRLPASLYYLVLKLRFRYGRWVSFGLVRWFKRRTSTGDSPVLGTPSTQAVHRLAQTKDLCLFGLPALLLWLVLLPSKKRYTDLYGIARAR